jgi:hypothetical protein
MMDENPEPTPEMYFDLKALSLDQIDAREDEPKESFELKTKKRPYRLLALYPDKPRLRPAAK